MKKPKSLFSNIREKMKLFNLYAIFFYFTPFADRQSHISFIIFTRKSLSNCFALHWVSALQLTSSIINNVFFFLNFYSFAMIDNIIHDFPLKNEFTSTNFDDLPMEKNDDKQLLVDKSECKFCMCQVYLNTNCQIWRALQKLCDL